MRDCIAFYALFEHSPRPSPLNSQQPRSSWLFILKDFGFS